MSARCILAEHVNAPNTSRLHDLVNLTILLASKEVAVFRRQFDLYSNGRRLRPDWIQVECRKQSRTNRRLSAMELEAVGLEDRFRAA